MIDLMIDAERHNPLKNINNHLIVEFDYHQLLSSTFDQANHRPVKPDVKLFNWKSFYFLFLIYLIQLLSDQVNCLASSSNQLNYSTLPAHNSQFQKNVNTFLNSKSFIKSINSEQIVNSVFSNRFRTLNNFNHNSNNKFNKFNHNDSSIDSLRSLKSLRNLRNLRNLKSLDGMRNELRSRRSGDDVIMKRRYVNDSTEQKGLIEKDLMNFNQKKQDKLARMLNSEQKFDSLKKRLSTPINSSYPVNRPSKSIGQKQFNVDKNLQSILNSENSLTLSDELIPDELEYRKMSKAKFCEICYCAGLDNGVLKCIKSNQLEFIPILPLNERRNIKEIYIENQDNFLELGEDQLKWYENIVKLTIQHTGLKDIKERTFRNNPHLKEIHLKYNKIKVLLRKLFDDLQYQELTINGNPLACNCSSKWIQLMIVNNNTNSNNSNSKIYEKLGPSAQNITCTDYTKKVILLSLVPLNGCDPPSLALDRKEIKVHEGDKFNLTCIASAVPNPHVSWNTTGLKSKFTIYSTQTTVNSTTDSTASFIDSVLTMNLNNQNNTANVINLNNSTAKSNSTSNVPTKRVLITKTIEISSANGLDNGLLSCFADNIIAKTIKTVNVTIYAAPKIELLETISKYHFCLSFIITGNPIPKRIWYFGKNEIKFNKTFTETVTKDLNSRNNFTIKGCLDVKTDTHLFNGDYVLKAKNEFGEVNRTIRDVVFVQTIKNPKSDGFTLPEPNSASTEEKITKDWKFIMLSILFLLAMVCILAFIFYFGCNYYSKKRTSPKDVKIVPQGKASLNISRFVDNPNYLIEKAQLINNLSDLGIKHIESNRIQLKKKLGEGEFGRVFLGTVLDLDKDKIISQTKHEKTLVAIKVLKHMKEKFSQEFKSEALLLSNLDHDNIVKFHGVSVDQNPFMMVFEYMRLGDLNTFLRSFNSNQLENGLFRKNSVNFLSFQTTTSASLNNNIDEKKDLIITATSNQTYQLENQNEDETTENDHLLVNCDNNHLKLSILEKKPINDETKSTADTHSLTNDEITNEPKTLNINDLFSISIQIGHGVRYLAQQHFIHRDLAARNCLVTNSQTNDSLVVKIGDFGMSREIHQSDYYKIGSQTVIPVRWMPPESIMYRRFTIDSDIWAYAVLLWEVWTLGKQPFFELSNLEVIQQVANGKKLDQPNNCPDEVFDLMEKCWKYDPNERIKIDDLYLQLEKLSEEYKNRSQRNDEKDDNEEQKKEKEEDKTVYESLSKDTN